MTDEDKEMKARGWETGDVQEFLGLSDDQMALIDLRVQLAKQIRLNRESMSIKQDELAKRISSTQPRVARIEAAAADVSLDQLVKALYAVGGRVDVTSGVAVPLVAEVKPKHRKAVRARTRKGRATKKVKG